MGVFTLRVRRFLAVNTLCIAAMSTLIGLSLVGIGFSTDNWKHISVDRIGVLTTLNASNLETDQDFFFDHRYFDRVEGMFRVCFPMEEKPRKRDDVSYLYLNTLQEWCTNIDYYMEDLTGPYSENNSQQKMTFRKVFSVLVHFRDFAFEILLNYGKRAFSRHSKYRISTTEQAFSIP